MKDECVKCKKTTIQLDDSDKLYWYCTHTNQEEMYEVDEGKEFLLCEMCFPEDELPKAKYHRELTKELK